MDVFSELEWRGLVSESTEGLRDVLAREKVTLYIGFDPTAASLHVGSLLPMMALARMQRFGHSPIAIVGGGTGMIGDPSGKTAERQLLTIDQIDTNLAGIRAQLAKVLDFDAPGNPARIVNNADWLRPLNYLDFLRDIGKHFTVNYMLAKESVKRRIDQEDGISYTEFSYLMLQSYDFLTLFDRYTCTLQMGGSDQWGNITAGADLIRRLRGAKAHGLVMPLVTTAGGVKFGKTEAGAVWLDPGLTSPFRFYQFWLNTDDRDVVKYLKYFTFLGQEEIGALEAAVAGSPERRDAQRVLAVDRARDRRALPIHRGPGYRGPRVRLAQRRPSIPPRAPRVGSPTALLPPALRACAWSRVQGQSTPRHSRGRRTCRFRRGRWGPPRIHPQPAA
jgi:tyrosyl-tRNA synthetase